MRYLKRTRNPMIDQGSWYYQLPFLEVEQFSITIGDTVQSKGTLGLLWTDGIVQSYNKSADSGLLGRGRAPGPGP